MKKLDIKRALTEHNMSQIELCQKIGAVQQNMSAIIRSGNPTVAKLAQIAEGIGCDITDLFYPDPSDEEMEKESSYLTMKELKDIMRRAYPSIKTESVEEIMKMIEEKGRAHADMEMLEAARSTHEGDAMGVKLTGDGIAGNGGEKAKNGGEKATEDVIKASAFCPHCGKKVRVGVILMDDE